MRFQFVRDVTFFSSVVVVAFACLLLFGSELVIDCCVVSADIISNLKPKSALRGVLENQRNRVRSAKTTRCRFSGKMIQHDTELIAFVHS